MVGGLREKTPTSPQMWKTSLEGTVHIRKSKAIEEVTQCPGSVKFYGGGGDSELEKLVRKRSWPG